MCGLVASEEMTCAAVGRHEASRLVAALRVAPLGSTLGAMSPTPSTSFYCGVGRLITMEK